ncbi:MAG: hypothetical protein WCC37_23505 [Candidatus Sulfotelmatobacter sp.]|jgi:hypothetical protein
MKTLSTIVMGFAIIAGVAAIFHSPIPADTQPIEAARAAYQDGLYLGRLTAKNGNLPKICSGRWSADEDRASFSAGYERGYATTMAGSMNATHAASAAFREGLFLGALAVSTGNPSIPSSGRWASARDQELFEEGYRQAYSQVRIQTASNVVRGAQ